MEIEEIKEILGLETIVEVDDGQKEVKMACGADLMSDVLAFIKEGALLLTGLTNPQVIRTAEIAGIKTICFVRGKKPPEETKKLAHEKGIQLFSTKLLLYESCGRLYKKGLPGCSEVP
jgi:hypothetical protein